MGIVLVGAGNRTIPPERLIPHDRSKSPTPDWPEIGYQQSSAQG